MHSGTLCIIVYIYIYVYIVYSSSIYSSNIYSSVYIVYSGTLYILAFYMPSGILGLYREAATVQSVGYLN